MLNDQELEDIRRKLLELEDEPPLGAWQKINRDVSPPRPWSFMWWLLALLLLVGVGIGLLLVPQQEKELAAISNAATRESLALASDSLFISQVPPAAEIPKPEFSAPSVEQAAGTPLPVAKGKEAGGRLAAGGLLAVENAENQGAKVPAPAATQAEPKKALAVEASKPASTRQRQEEQVSEAEAGKNQSLTAGDSSWFYLKEAARTDARAEKQAPAVPLIIKAEEGHSAMNQLKAVDSTVVRFQQNGNSTGALLPQDKEVGLQNVSLFSSGVQGPDLQQLSPSEPDLIFAELPRLISMPAVLKLQTGNLFKDSGLVAAKPQQPVQEVHKIVPEADRRENKAWGAGLFFTPRYTYRSYTPRTDDEVLVTAVNSTAKTPRDRIGYELGLSFHKAVTGRIALETSLGYMKLKENLAYTYTNGSLLRTERNLTASGEVLQKAVYATSDRHLNSTYAYANWRIAANYILLRNTRRRLHIMAGAGASLLLKGKTEVYENGELAETLYFPSENNILEQSNYQLMVGVGYNRTLLAGWELSVMPVLSYFLGSTYQKREPLGLKPYSLGMQLQLIKQFAR